MICPPQLIAAAAVVQAAGREADILRSTLPVCLVAAVLAGLVALL